MWSFGGDWFDPAYALPVSPKPRLLTTPWRTLKKEIAFNTLPSNPHALACGMWTAKHPIKK